MRCFVAGAASLISFAAIAAEPLTPDNFGTRFNNTLRSLDIKYRAGRTECAEKVARTCTYRFESVGFVVKSQNGGKEFDYATVICAKDCQPVDFAMAVAGVARVLSPGLPRAQYGEWLPVMSRVLSTKTSETIEIGRAEIQLSANNLTGIMAVIGQK